MAEHSTLPPNNSNNLSLLCFDYGLARIGVATAHLLTGQAAPVTTLSCKNGIPDWTALTRLIDEWHPNMIIVGNPGATDQNKSLLKKIRSFCIQLRSRYDLEVVLHDESLSSFAAYDQLKNMRKYRNKRISKEQIDQLAAALILQSWIDQNT